MTLSLFIGRSLAFMRHPLLAWSRLTPEGRAALAAGYGTLSYLAALGALIALHG